MNRSLKLNQPFFELAHMLEYDSVGRIVEALLDRVAQNEMPDETSACCENLNSEERAIVYLLCREIIDGMPSVSVVES